MKIVSYNINGVRSATAKGLVDFINSTDADIYCIQEVRATKAQCMEALSSLNQTFNVLISESERKGYSGTAIITKLKPVNFYTSLPSFVLDKEGRFSILELDNLIVVNCYVPNGGTRLEHKLDFMDRLNNDLKSLISSSKKEVVFCTDINIAHTELDVSKPNKAKHITGFLPNERQKFNDTLNAGLYDSFRELNPKIEHYSWTSYKAKTFGEDFGIAYRFDYIFVTKKLLKSVKSCIIETSKPYSDHYPVLCDIEI